VFCPRSGSAATATAQREAADLRHPRWAAGGGARTTSGLRDKRWRAMSIEGLPTAALGVPHRPPSTIRPATTHVTVCVCTYRRPDVLGRLLGELATQETRGLFTYSVVVVDNDRDRSAQLVVSALATTYPAPLAYCVEPQRSIARARNRAIDCAEGEFVAFIDDDELPIRIWLLTLLTVCVERGVDGVLGPVKPIYETAPPRWLTLGKFYERPDHPTGLVIEGSQGRTGNVLLRRSLFSPGAVAFRPEFVTGEDQDFFRRSIAAGHVFIWSREAIAYEIVPRPRWKRTYILRKALMRGTYSVLEPTAGALDAAKSLVAVCVYTAMLPLLFLGGQHHLMRYLDKLCYHAGKLLAYAKISPVGSAYVSE
jgi:succinoglycan biosynthesis protein ExoM